MSNREAVIERIHSAFGPNEHPGEGFLQGSFDGCEPYEEVSPFKSFLRAYLVADLHGRLSTADPLFHLTHGFSDITTEVPARDRVLVIRKGGSAFVNPRRYGAMTFYDYARCRLSVFTREEASAIVAYLEFKRDSDPNVYDKASIDAALESFWLEREKTAPPAESLGQHIAEEVEYLAAVRSSMEDSSGEG